MPFKGTISKTTDINNINTNAYYDIGGDIPINYPNGAYEYGTLVVISGTYTIVQKIYTHNRPDIYVRAKYAGADKEWTPWGKFTSVVVQ